jgi:hypothetical protein
MMVELNLEGKKTEINFMMNCIEYIRLDKVKSRLSIDSKYSSTTEGSKLEKNQLVFHAYLVVS